MVCVADTVDGEGGAMAVDMEKVAELLHGRFGANVIEVYPGTGICPGRTHLSVLFRHWRTARVPVAVAQAGPYAVAACVGDTIAGMLAADEAESEAFFQEQLKKTEESK
jgi:hypothetical protein